MMRSLGMIDLSPAFGNTPSLRLVTATVCFGCLDKWHALIDGKFGRKTISEDLAVRRWETRTRMPVGGFNPLLVGLVPD